MRRVTAGLFGLGLLAAVTATIASGPIAGTVAAAEGCVWHRHAKPVVKHLKRHGRVRRVKRVKRWWTCDPRPGAPTPTTTPPAPPPTVTPPTEEEGSPLSRLSVKAVEWSYTLSRPEVEAGEVLIELNNQGEDSHNLQLQREDSAEPPLLVPEAGSAKRTSARFALSSGTYHLYCSLYQHGERGMQATLVVGS